MNMAEKTQRCLGAAVRNGSRLEFERLTFNLKVSSWFSLQIKDFLIWLYPEPTFDDWEPLSKLYV